MPFLKKYTGNLAGAYTTATLNETDMANPTAVGKAPVVTAHTSSTGETSVTVTLTATSPEALSMTLYWTTNTSLSPASPYTGWSSEAYSSPKAVAVTRDYLIENQILRAFAVDSGGLVSAMVFYTIDYDRVPELSNAVAEFVTGSTVRVRWNGDDDVASVEIEYDDTGDGTYDEAPTPTYYDTASGTSNAVAITEGETLFFKVTPYTATGGAGGAGTAGNFIEFNITLPATSSATAPYITARTTSTGETSVDVTLVATSPPADNLTLYWTTNTSQDVGSFTGSQAGASPQTKVVTVTRDRYVENTLLRAYALDVSGRYSTVVVYAVDFDTLPELISANAEFDTSSTVRARFNGDDDVASVEFEYCDTWANPLVYDEAPTPSYSDNASGISSSVAIGDEETLYWRVTPYDDTGGAGGTGNAGVPIEFSITKLTGSLAPYVTVQTKSGTRTTSTVTATLTATSPGSESMTLYWTTNPTLTATSPYTGWSSGAYTVPVDVVMNRVYTDSNQILRALVIDASSRVSDMVTYTVDYDTLPEIVSAEIDLVSSQTIRGLWDGDDDVASVVVKWGSAYGTYGNTVGTFYNDSTGQSSNVTTIYPGSDTYWQFTPYSGTGATGDAGIPIVAQFVYPPCFMISAYSEKHFDAEGKSAGDEWKVFWEADGETNSVVVKYGTVQGTYSTTLGTYNTNSGDSGTDYIDVSASDEFIYVQVTPYPLTGGSFGAGDGAGTAGKPYTFAIRSRDLGPGAGASDGSTVKVLPKGALSMPVGHGDLILFSDVYANIPEVLYVGGMSYEGRAKWGTKEQADTVISFAFDYMYGSVGVGDQITQAVSGATGVVTFITGITGTSGTVWLKWFEGSPLELGSRKWIKNEFFDELTQTSGNWAYTYHDGIGTDAAPTNSAIYQNFDAVVTTESFRAVLRLMAIAATNYVGTSAAYATPTTLSSVGQSSGAASISGTVAYNDQYLAAYDGYISCNKATTVTATLILEYDDGGGWEQVAQAVHSDTFGIGGGTLFVEGQLVGTVTGVEASDEFRVTLLSVSGAGITTIDVDLLPFGTPGIQWTYLTGDAPKYANATVEGDEVRFVLVAKS